jgi:peptidoglycan/LPS O-acetylase OafA/YrhL
LQNRIEPLDSLRGIFALLVVVYHAYIGHHFLTASVVRNGGLAVDYFFLLSGFVISLAYSHKLPQPGGFWRFAVQRVARLWPLHLVMFAGFIGLYLLRVAIGTQEVSPAFLGLALQDLLLLNSLGNESFSALNLPAWSISVEMWVYVLFGLVAVCGLPVLGLSVVLILASGAVLLELFNPGFGLSYDKGLFHGIFFFFIGTLCHRAYLHLIARDIGFGTLAELAVVVAIILAFVFYPATLWASVGVALIFAAAILVLSRGHGIVSGALSTRPLLALGRLSFSIYMTHYLVLQLASTAMRFVDNRTATPLRLAGGPD